VTLAFYPSLNRLSNVQHLTLGSGGASLSGDANGAMTADTADTATNIWRAGRGKALGQPNGTITTATSGAGGLTGTFKYAYTETDGSGETTISAQATQVAAANTVQVTMPLPRKGVSSRKLYRTVAGGSSFFLLHDFGGGNGYYQTIWLDNTADGSLGAAAPTSDTSAVYEQEITATVSFWRAHPDAGTNPSDVTFLRADNQNAGGSLNIDSYGTIYCRQSLSDAYSSLMTGVTGHHFQGYWLGTTDDGVAPVSVFHVYPRGEVKIDVPTLTDFGAGGNYPFEVKATMPSTVTATVQCAHVQLTGAGSSSNNIRAFISDFLAGYTGSGQLAAIYGSNASAGTGGAHGVYGRATGGNSQNVGVTGRANGGTKNIGVAGVLSMDPDGLNRSAAIVCSNGATTDDIFVALDNTAIVLQIVDGGQINVNGPGSMSFTDAVNIGIGTTTGTKIGTGTTQKIGVWNATPVVRPSAYTQTYATATRTHSNPTAVSVTDNTGGSADTTLQSIGASYSQTEVRNNFADLAAQHNALVADLANVKQLLNQVIDDQQLIGWFA
jgi:hypothetical protein